MGLVVRLRLGYINISSKQPRDCYTMFDMLRCIAPGGAGQDDNKHELHSKRAHARGSRGGTGEGGEKDKSGPLN